MRPRHHVVISGTGRCGTTFLVELLTRLGLDTGFSEDDLRRGKSEVAHAGLEWDIREPGVPYVIKNPWFCNYAAEVMARPDIVIDHLFIPMRDVYAAAESRRRVQREHLAGLSLKRRLRELLRPGVFAGGLVGTRSTGAGDQEQVLMRQFYDLCHAAAEADVPVTLISFPRLVHDAGYLHAKLRPVLGGLSAETFGQVFAMTAQPGLVHQFGKNDPTLPAAAPAMPPVHADRRVPGDRRSTGAGDSKGARPAAQAQAQGQGRRSGTRGV